MYKQLTYTTYLYVYEKKESVRSLEKYFEYVLALKSKIVVTASSRSHINTWTALFIPMVSYAQWISISSMKLSWGNIISFMIELYKSDFDLVF